MSSIYKDLLTVADNGGKIKVDLINKSLWVNGKQIIKEGEIHNEQDKSKELINLPNDLATYFGAESTNEPWDLVEIIYDEFQKSVPGKKEVKSYFKSKSVDELTDADLAYNYDRYFASIMLEGFILLAGLKGLLKWQNPDHWFWQGSNPNLIILRMHIETI